MKREFTAREKGLLLVLVVLIIALGYFKLIWEPIHAQITELEGKTLQEQLLIDQQTIRLARMKYIQQQLEEMQASGDPAALPAFDNSGAVVLELHRVLATAGDYTLDFEDTERNDRIVVRPITVKFRADSYETARGILDGLSQSVYFNRITDLDIQWQAQAGVSVYMRVTYYEVI